MAVDNEFFVDADDDWNDIDFSDLTDEPDGNEDVDSIAQNGNDTNLSVDENENNVGSSFGKPTEENSTQEPTETSTNTDTITEANHSFKLKYFGEEKEYSRDDTIVLAQKGLDYDRIRNKYDSLQPEYNSMKSNYDVAKEKADFLDELATAQGIDAKTLINRVKVTRLSKEKNISSEEAEKLIKMQELDAEIAKKQAVVEQEQQTKKREEDAEAARRQQFMQFYQNHKDVKASDIPTECWKDMQNGIPLEVSYQNRMSEKNLSELRAQMAERDKAYAELMSQKEALEQALEENKKPNQNELNKRRSVGSAETSGKGSKPSAFDAMWYDDN